LQPHILKISTLESSQAAETLRLEGHLGGPWVDELRRSCDQVLSKGKRLTLNLFDVSFIDRDGVALLRTLKRRDVEVRNCSPFVALQLEEDNVR
jgi:ABC-type transporter Mla MlaB component